MTFSNLALKKNVLLDKNTEIFEVKTFFPSGHEKEDLKNMHWLMNCAK